MSVTIRGVTPDDAGALLSIYRPYVLDTAITFEYDVPSLEEFRERITHTIQKYPYLCAEEDGKILGYAYAGAFKERAAYQWSVELSIYLDKDCHGHGYGRLLYAALESALKEMGIINLYACIAYPEKDDEYLTNNSVDFHAHLGFKKVGDFKNCANKFGRWYHMTWMEKIIAEYEENPKTVKGGSLPLAPIPLTTLEKSEQALPSPLRSGISATPSAGRGSGTAFTETRLKTCLTSFFASATGSLPATPPRTK